MRAAPSLALALASASLLFAQPKTDAASADPILTAMNAEMQRARRLTLLGMLPYYFQFSVDDATTFSVSATLGATYGPQRHRLRPLRARARVGDLNFDNANSIYSDFFNGTRYDPDRLPDTNEQMVLRRALWLAADRAFKTAIDGYGRKQALLRGVTVNDPMPDFSPAAKLNLVLPSKNYKVDESLWTLRVKSLSEAYLKFPGITGSSVDFESSSGNTYLVTSEGTTVRAPDGIFILRTRAARQAPDGDTIYDGVAMQALEPEMLPAEAELRGAVLQVAENVEALAAAPTGEAYVGPILFTAEAAGQIVAELIGSQLAPIRRPVSEPGRSLPIQPSELEGRLGSRILPEWMSIVDDPSAKEWQGRPLIGHYEADLEGVAPQRLSVVDKGVLKAFLATRTPAPGVKVSNGRARLPGALGMNFAKPSNLLVENSQPVPEDGMKTRMLDMIRQGNKPYGVIVRKMDYPSSGSLGELRSVGRQAARAGGGRLISSPVLVYKVFPDGREELVRGLRFRGFNARSFRDIVAAGDKPAAFHFLENGAPLNLMGAGNFVIGCSVVSPSLLFEELELSPQDEDRPRLPVVPSPLAETR